MTIQEPAPIALEGHDGQAPLRPPPEAEAPPSAAALRYTIAIRLTSGDLITAGETEGSDKAAALGQAVVADVTSDDGEWPFFGGRYINPETIISVDLLPEDSDG